MSNSASRVRLVRAAFPDDGDVATVYRGAAAIVAAGGAISAIQAGVDPHLTRHEVRRARILGVTCLVVGIAGAISQRTGGIVARALRGRPPLTVLAGLVPTVAAPLTGGGRTPTHFLSVTGMGLAGGVLGTDRGPRLAPAGSVAWLFQSHLARRRSPARPQPDPIWLNVVMPLGYVGTAVIGAAAGEGALRARSLQHTLRRFEAHVRDLDGVRDRLQEATEPFLEALAEFEAVGARHPESERGSMIVAAARRSRDRLGDVTAAIAAAGRAAESPTTPLEQLIRRAAEQVAGDLPVRVTGSTENAVLAPRVQLAAHLVVLRAIANARTHAETTEIEVRLSRTASGELRLQIVNWTASNADEPVAPLRLGKGTRDSQAMLHSLGGSLELRRIIGGFEVDARLPVDRFERSSAGRSVAQQLVDLVERAVWEVVRINAVMVLALAWGSDQYVGPHRRRSQVLATLGVGLAELAWHTPWGSRARRLEILLGAVTLLELFGAHAENAPVAGWGGMILSCYALEAPTRRVLTAAVAQATANIVSFRGRRDQFGTTAVRESIGMVLGALAALPARRAFAPVERREERLAGLIEQLEQLQGIAEDVAYRTHGFAEPVENALGLLGSHPVVDRLISAIDALASAGTDLSRMLEDRRRLVDELAESLAYRVWPAPVELRDDVRSLSYPRADSVIRTAAARRRVLDSMAFAADHLLQQVRPGPLGQWPLEAVELTISDLDDDRLLITLAPRPRQPRGDKALRELTSSLAGLGGTVTDGFADGRLTFSVALASD